MLAAFCVLDEEYAENTRRLAATWDGREYRDPLSSNHGHFTFSILGQRIAALQAGLCNGGAPSAQDDSGGL